MFKIIGIDHIVLRVADLDRMLAFYCDVLGCVVERREDRIGLIQLRAGAAMIDLEQYPIGSNRFGSIRSDKIARHFKKIEHLNPINWIA